MRVIAGRLGGRRLVAPSGTSTRPTSDRVREALFSILADVTGARVLDLYAGTGALGIEALSRGAARAVFVEAAPRTTAVLKKNLEALGLGKETQVLSVRVDRAVEPVIQAGPYDLVLVDPPYADIFKAADLVGGLGERGAFAEDARIVIEHATGIPPPPIPGAEVVSERRYGDTGVTLATWVGSP
ncbi:MAG: 16S rRNA (guanine(966)-N(2))-methyltransferase RsmD [Polyangiaceae bacterium]|nr:16S rRNA (guanine(966)-N(2))-methyltransferase RsmD [Polyangiaceae bacterium]